VPGQRERTNVSQAGDVMKVRRHPSMAITDWSASATSSASTANAIEGRTFVTRWPQFDIRTDDPQAESEVRKPSEPPVDARGDRLPKLVAPVLVLVATLAIFEGYAWLNVFPRDRINATAISFAVLLLPITVVVTRHPRGGHRGPVQRVLVGAAIALLGVTLIALVLNRPTTELVLGAVDLAVAVAALSVALPGERSATRRH
jgi:hypothetical protein